ncbi:MAG: serine/threonine protein phosphatase [Clostridia bacterium]|nr:serine/threonine protein phosphatase [Clostridia bacterium]
MKIYAMSDIHGHLQEFETALAKVDLSGDNILILLGDYIHGPDSYGVLDRVMQLQEKYGAQKVIALRGNHEEMAADGFWKINEDRFGVVGEFDDNNDDKYLEWMSKLPLYRVMCNTIFVHAGIDEEAAAEGYWELGTGEHFYTGKFPAETGKIPNFDMKIVAGHVGTSNIAGDPNFHDIFFDGGSHYYIDGTVQKSGEIPVIMYDSEKDNFYRVSDLGERLILPYDVN